MSLYFNFCLNENKKSNNCNQTMFYINDYIIFLLIRFVIRLHAYEEKIKSMQSVQ